MPQCNVLFSSVGQNDRLSFIVLKYSHSLFSAIGHAPLAILSFHSIGTLDYLLDRLAELVL